MLYPGKRGQPSEPSINSLMTYTTLHTMEVVHRSLFYFVLVKSRFVPQMKHLY